MKKTLAIAGAILAAILFSGSVPSSPYNSILEREIQNLTERGLRVRLLGEVVEATDPVSGQKWHFSTSLLIPREPAYTGIPTLTIDLRALDTNQYNWKYRYKSSFPASSEWGFPLQVKDIDRNGRYEAYGAFQTQTSYRTRIYELDPNGSWTQRYSYPIDTGVPDKQGDLDGDGKTEVYFRFTDSLFAFEQTSMDSLPTTPKFRHRQWYFGSTGIPNQVFDIDNNAFPEILYQGSEPDSLHPPTGDIRKTYVTRYNPINNNLDRIWSQQLPAGCAEYGCVSAIACGELDGDSRMDFVTSAEDGGVFVVEHVVKDSFALVWTDSLSIARRVAIGDVDGNGISEFFVGAEQPEADGYAHLRVYAYERTGDNSYEPVFAFDIYPVALFFVSLFQTTDIDGDGRPELILSFGGGPVILKGSGTHAYEVFYYTQANYLDATTTIPIETGKGAALFVSRHLGGQPIVKVTDVYDLDSSLVVGVREQTGLPVSARLFQNYPNPFNPTTNIEFRNSNFEFVTLKVFDLLGREVASLVDGRVEAGNHSATLDASHLSSGIYFYRLTAGKFRDVKKLVLMK